jgi:GTP-binding protein
MSLFPHVQFLLGAHQPKQFPDDSGVEVAIAGRSNAGKSSAINAIVGRQNLARSSKTPGRTQQINFFELRPAERLVDLPGYGFAKVPINMRRHWGALLESYFAQRQSLMGAVVVMDSRHPLTAIDEEMLALAATRALPVHVLLTKVDKLSRSAGMKTLAEVRKALGGRATVQLFSATAKTGVDDAREVLKKWFGGKRIADDSGK